jgi:hypothetical protein
MVRFKSIRLYPSTWYLDVYVSKSIKLLTPIFHKRYGDSIEYYSEHLALDSCTDLYSTLKSELKGKGRIIIILASFDLSIIIHESEHALWYFSKNAGVEMNQDSQEWQSIMIEYITEEIRKRKDYIKL